MPSIKKPSEQVFLAAVLNACRAHNCEAWVQQMGKTFQLTFVALGEDFSDVAGAVASMGRTFRNVSMVGVHHTDPQRPDGYRLYPLLSSRFPISLLIVDGVPFCGLKLPCKRLEMWDDVNHVSLGILGDCTGKQRSASQVSALCNILDYGAEEYLLTRAAFEGNDHCDFNGFAFPDEGNGFEAPLLEASQCIDACNAALAAGLPDWVNEAVQHGFLVPHKFDIHKARNLRPVTP